MLCVRNSLALLQQLSFIEQEIELWESLYQAEGRQDLEELQRQLILDVFANRIREEEYY